MSILFKRVRQKRRLKRAWNYVLSQGLKSYSKRTQDEVELFKTKEDIHLNRIGRELKEDRFLFKGVKGFLLPKKTAGQKRGIVLIPVDCRIVQRSSLEVLQELRPIKDYLQTPTSFGAIKNKGVPEAIKAVACAIENGAGYYIKSDIAEFFTKIPIGEILNKIETDIKDKQFTQFLEKAINLEIENFPQLRKYHRFFEFHEAGVPQGCCLSPLFGNILLNDFDKEMNLGGVICLRFLDDFIIFAPNEKAANVAFSKAQNLLKKFNMFAYDPAKGQEKATKGHINKRFEFLGVEIYGDKIRPSRSNSKKIIRNIGEILNESIKEDFSKVIDGSSEKKAYIQTLYKINNKFKGWGNQYYFCNDPAVFGSIEAELNKKLKKYEGNYFKKHRRLEKQQVGDWKNKQRRLLGVHVLRDSKSEPIMIKTKIES